VQHAEAVGTQKQVLRRGMTNNVGGGRFQAAGADTLQRDIELLRLHFAAVNGSSD